jgi:hypothetical protein
MTATIGDNGGPPIDPLAAYVIDAADLLDEANGMTEITNQDQADAVKNMVARAKASEKGIDAAKDGEKRPHLDANTAIDARYKPVKAQISKAKAAGQSLLTPWDVRLANERDAAAKLLRDNAAAIAAAAIEARRSDDLLEQMDAEQAIAASAKMAVNANKLDKVASGLRTYWEAEMNDPLAFGKWLWTHSNDDYLAFLNEQADKAIRVAKHDLPGVNAIERKVSR